MNLNTEKNWETLYEKYPDLFANKNKSIKESCMAWGIECNFGWYDILSALCWSIQDHEKNLKWHREYLEKNNPEKLKDEPEYFPVKFDQIKEKFGGLRIYYSGGDSYISGAISMASEMSYKICEVCGNSGKPNKGGWIVTLCENCRTDTNS